MLISSWLRNPKRSPAAVRRIQTSTRQRASFPPRLEALEDRCLFSTLTVTSASDSGTGSLRAEIAAAQNGDTIVFSPTLSTSSALASSTTLLSFAVPLTSSAKSNGSNHGHGKPTAPPPPPPPPPATPAITLTSGELLLDKNLTIQGPGAGLLAIGGSGSRAFEMAVGTTVTLSGLAIGGSSSGWAAYPDTAHWDGYGGGILNHGTLTVNGCTVNGSIEGSESEGGAIFSDGTLILNSSTVTGFAQGGSTSGGGISNLGSATLTNTVVSNSQADPPSTLSYPWYNKGGGIINHGTVTLNGCTVSGNNARSAGGGIFNDGTLILDNSKVFGNSTSYGGGIYNAGTITLQNSSSITGNNDAYGADVDNVGVLNRDGTSTIGILVSFFAPLDFG